MERVTLSQALGYTRSPSIGQQIFPLEVKAGFSKKKKSLRVYAEKFSQTEGAPPLLSRASLRNFAHDGEIVNYPLYAVRLFPRFLPDSYKPLA